MFLSLKAAKRIEDVRLHGLICHHQIKYSVSPNNLVNLLYSPILSIFPKNAH